VEVVMVATIYKMGLKLPTVVAQELRVKAIMVDKVQELLAIQHQVVAVVVVALAVLAATQQVHQSELAEQVVHHPHSLELLMQAVAVAVGIPLAVLMEVVVAEQVEEQALMVLLVQQTQVVAVAVAVFQRL
jgi:hypothetical protein